MLKSKTKGTNEIRQYNTEEGGARGGNRRHTVVVAALKKMAACNEGLPPRQLVDTKPVVTV